MNATVTVKFNVLGINLKESEINAVLNYEETSKPITFQREWLAGFFHLSQTELTRDLLSRYAEADSCMSRISAGTNHKDIHSRLISTLASAKRCYSYGEYLASIELCALHGEMLANYLFITSKDDINSVLSKLSEKDRKKIDVKCSDELYFSDGLGQLLRLRLLIKANVIDHEDKKQLEKIHGLRIKYFHHWQKMTTNEAKSALVALSAVSLVSVKYLEILGNGRPEKFNNANLDRVKRYMKIVDKQSE
jgi:hypothetical protein